MRELRRSFALNLREEESRTRRQQKFAYTRKVGWKPQHREGASLGYPLPLPSFLLLLLIRRVHPSLPTLGPALRQLLPLCSQPLPLTGSLFMVQNHAQNTLWLKSNKIEPQTKEILLSSCETHFQGLLPLLGNQGLHLVCLFSFNIFFNKTWQHTAEPLACQLDMEMEIHAEEKGNNVVLTPFLRQLMEIQKTKGGILCILSSLWRLRNSFRMNFAVMY